MAAEKVAFYQRCGDNQKSGSALEDHMKKDTVSLFGIYAEPQMTLQKLREYTSKGNEAKHEELWKKLNMEAFVDRYITSFYKTKVTAGGEVASRYQETARANDGSLLQTHHSG